MDEDDAEEVVLEDSEEFGKVLLSRRFCQSCIPRLGAERAVGLAVMIIFIIYIYSIRTYSLSTKTAVSKGKGRPGQARHSEEGAGEEGESGQGCRRRVATRLAWR